MSLTDRDGWPGSAGQGVEVLPDSRDLVAVPDLVAHAEEDVLDLAADLGQQVQPPAVDPDARDGHVDAARVREPGSGEPGGGLLVRSFERGAQRVQRQAGLAVADAAKCLRQRRLATEEAHVGVRELVGGRGGLVRGQCFGFDTRSSPPRRHYPRFEPPSVCRAHEKPR